MMSNHHDRRIMTRLKARVDIVVVSVASFFFLISVVALLALSSSSSVVLLLATAQTTCAPAGGLPVLLPCLPCANGGVCNGTSRYTHTDGQIFGRCNCSGTPYTGPQCDRLSNASCTVTCRNGGYCAGGVCECPPTYGDIDCGRVRCGNLVSGVKVVPNAQGFCPAGEECLPGYGDEFCMNKVDVRACQSGEIYSRSLYTSEEDMRRRCFSGDGGWVALLGGTSSIFQTCHKPGGWNGTDPNTGWCTMEFYRNASGSGTMEELFSCNFSKCVVSTTGLQTSQIQSRVVDFGALVVEEPAGALALRILLFLTALFVALLALLGDRVPRPDLAVPCGLGLVLFFLVLNLTAAADAYASANEENNVEYSRPSGDDVLLNLKCLEAECSCFPAIITPNCGDNPTFNNLVTNLKGELDFLCNDIDGECTFTHADLFGFNIAMQCEPRDCRSRVESTEDLERNIVPEEEKSYVLPIIACILAGVVLMVMIVSCVLHLASYGSLEKEWKELLRRQQEDEENEEMMMSKVNVKEGGEEAEETSVVVEQGVGSEKVVGEKDAAKKKSEEVLPPGEIAEKQGSEDKMDAAVALPVLAEGGAGAPMMVIASSPKKKVVKCATSIRVQNVTYTVPSIVKRQQASSNPKSDDQQEGGVSSQSPVHNNNTLPSLQGEGEGEALSTSTQAAAAPTAAPTATSAVSPDSSTVIINNISHTFKGGELTAIMGPSGCGKTTLLDIMCNRDKSGSVIGDVSVALTFVHQDQQQQHKESKHRRQSQIIITEEEATNSSSSVKKKDNKTQNNDETTKNNWEKITHDNMSTFRRLISYVADDDVILPTLTVTEALLYACELRQPVYIPREEKQIFVQRLISMFRLHHCQHTVIGSAGASEDSAGGGGGGLSQGERRRTAIAMHLCALPRILVLDEPTTGLDSYNARLVIQSLRNATTASSASNNNSSAAPSVYHDYYPAYYNYQPTVILSIHQPSMDLLEMFDSVVLMARGLILYAGPVHGEKLEGFIVDGLQYVQAEHERQQVEWKKEKKKKKQEATTQNAKNCTAAEGNDDDESDEDEEDQGRDADYLEFLRAVSPTTTRFAGSSSYDEKEPTTQQRNESALDEDSKNAPSPLPNSEENPSAANTTTTTTTSHPALRREKSRKKLNSIPLPDRLLLFATMYHGPPLVASPTGNEGVQNEKVDEEEEGPKNLNSTVAPPSKTTGNNTTTIAVAGATNGNSSSTATTTTTTSMTPHIPTSALIETQNQSRFLPPFWTQCKLLIIRGWMHLLRRKSIFALHYLVASLVALLISFMYQASDRDVPGTLSKAGALTFYLLWLSVINLSALDLLLSERATFVFERNAACYSAGAYFLTKLVLDILILRMIPTALGGTVIYFPIGMKPTVSAFGNFIGVTMLFSITTAALSILIASVAPSFGPGLLLNGFVLMIYFAFGGFISQDSLVPAGLRWLRYLSPFNFAFEIILVRDLEGQVCTFVPRDAAGTPTTTVTITLQCEQYLYNLGLNPTEVPLDIALLALWAGFYLVIGYVMLQFFVRGRR